VNHSLKGTKPWSTPVARQHGSFYEVTRQGTKDFGAFDGQVLNAQQLVSI
jgi:hypothetical protein